MSLNHKEIDIVLRELRLPGCFVQNIAQPSYDSLALYIYGEGGARTVFICLAAGACRIHQTDRKIPKTAKPLRFMEFARAHIKGGKIIAAEQLPCGRIILLRIARGGLIYLLYARLWSGASNVIITDEDHTILDVFYRRPKRGEITGGRFTPEELPPPGQSSGERAYEARQLPGEGSFNQKVDAWYAEREGASSRDALLEQARKKYNAQITRLTAALGRLEAKSARFENADRLRRHADLIMGNIGTIKPGDTSLTAADYETGETVKIPLDPAKTPARNAEALYAEYKKAASGKADLDKDIEKQKNEIERLKTRLAALENETNPLALRQALQKQNRRETPAKSKYPGLVFRIGEWVLLVGRSAAENDELLRRFVRGSDIWLHARDWRGAYVFIKARRQKTAPLEILLDAGTLAVFYSKARNAGKADVYYTYVKYLRRAKNGPKGLVIPTQEKNLSIALSRERLDRLEQSRGAGEF